MGDVFGGERAVEEFGLGQLSWHLHCVGMAVAIGKFSTVLA